MNVACKEYENFGAEEGDCLLELVRLYELESDNPQVTWETVTKSFNETIGTIYSVDKLKNIYYQLKSQQKYFTLPAKHLVNDFEIQRLKAEKARENAENMTEKAEEAKKKRIELELEVLEIQKQREQILLEVAKAKLTKSKY